MNKKDDSPMNEEDALTLSPYVIDLIARSTSGRIDDGDIYFFILCGMGDFEMVEDIISALSALGHIQRLDDGHVVMTETGRAFLDAHPIQPGTVQ